MCDSPTVMQARVALKCTRPSDSRINVMNFCDSYFAEKYVEACISIVLDISRSMPSRLSTSPYNQFLFKKSDPNLIESFFCMYDCEMMDYLKVICT